MMGRKALGKLLYASSDVARSQKKVRMCNPFLAGDLNPKPLNHCGSFLVDIFITLKPLSPAPQIQEPSNLKTLRPKPLTAKP